MRADLKATALLSFRRRPYLCSRLLPEAFLRRFYMRKELGVLI